MEVWDFSARALAKAQRLAELGGVRVRTVEIDLSRCSLPRDAFDVILCFYFTQRDLWESMQWALRPGGVLVMENRTAGTAVVSDGSVQTRFMLRPNELLRAFPALDVVHHEERVLWRDPGEVKPVASLVARRARAVEGASDGGPQGSSR